MLDFSYENIVHRKTENIPIWTIWKWCIYRITAEAPLGLKIKNRTTVENIERSVIHIKEHTILQDNTIAVWIAFNNEYKSHLKIYDYLNNYQND